MTNPDELERMARAATPTKYEGYSITRGGAVLSFHPWRGQAVRELKTSPNSHGYPSVHLKTNGRMKRVLVHTLVAEAYLPPRPEGHQVRHLDGAKANNHADNLAWGTAKQNADDRAAHGTSARGSRNGFSKMTEDLVAQIRSSSDSAQVLADRLGLSQSAVARARRGATWSHVQ